MNDQIEQAFRREVGRCIATLIRVIGDIDPAEDAVALDDQRYGATATPRESAPRVLGAPFS